jgi:hypothetical protein
MQYERCRWLLFLLMLQLMLVQLLSTPIVPAVLELEACWPSAGVGAEAAPPAVTAAGACWAGRAVLELS